MQLVSVYDAFAPVYSDWSAEMTDDVPFYVELARETDEFVWVSRKPM